MIHPRTFAERYVAAWNMSNVDAVLDFFDANAELRSPFAKLFAKSGVIQGTSQLRAFCEESLRRRPNLKLDLLDVFAGHDAASLRLRDEVGRSTVFTAVFTPLDKVALAILCYNSVGTSINLSTFSQ